MRIAYIVAATASSSLGMFAAHPAGAADAKDSDTLEQVVVTGTRVANRSALDTAAPVDVVSGEQLQNLGVTEVNQALSVALPSFNFPRPGLSDGTDVIRPATLRGLAPDQTLVLVNGKRRHAASLVNVNGTIGRGSAAVDLNTIPTAMVQSVEVLRDGASAQYGSDAIAGVVNLRLREAREGGGVDLTYGWRDSDYDMLTGAPPANATWSAPSTLSRSVSDGETITASIWKGLSLADSGFLTVAAEYKDQEHTERGGWDFRQQYPLLANGAFDPREQTFNRFNGWYGEPELQQKTVFANLGYDVSDDVAVYGWASWQDRDSLGAGFYRPAQDVRNIQSIYPDGFLPFIAAEVTDYSAAFGTRWTLGEWNMDSSLVYGKNKMEFTIENTLNRSLGPTSKTTFDAGGFDADQLVLNVSAVRPVAVSAFASPLNIAVGLEARRESYSIFAGEEGSYINGGALLPFGGPGCPAATSPPAGCPTASGSQVFPGFRPENAVDEDRTAVGAYVDLEANVTEKFLASVAARAEDYSDFGNNLSGKLSLRYDFTQSFALRGSVQNGFRAPSLQQKFFSTTSTNNINGRLFDITTFAVTNPIAQALGAQDLDAEESMNFSLGTVLRFGELDVTIDAYRIDIDDRIVLSENLQQANVLAYLAANGLPNTQGSRFFLNGVDTTTEGVDVVVNYPLVSAAAGRFDLTLAANFNSTEVTRVPQTAQLAALNPAPVLFDHLNVLTFEEGTPKDKFAGAVNWSLNRLGATLRVTRYGEVLAPGTTVANDLTLGAKTLLDIEGRFDFTDHIRASIGADNLTDVYPERNPPRLNTTGTTSFNNYSPFGRSGRFIYGKLNYRF
jgi:iron complex outermembrane receptor protein